MFNEITLVSDILRTNGTEKWCETTGRINLFRIFANEVFVFMLWDELFHCYNSDGKEEEQVTGRYLVQYLASQKMDNLFGNRHFQITHWAMSLPETRVFSSGVSSCKCIPPSWWIEYDVILDFLSKTRGLLENLLWPFEMEGRWILMYRMNKDGIR